MNDYQPAKVKWFNRARGFGFITRGKNTPDIFVHMAVLRTCGINGLQPAQKVAVKSTTGPKGELATEVKLK